MFEIKNNLLNLWKELLYPYFIWYKLTLIGVGGRYGCGRGSKRGTDGGRGEEWEWGVGVQGRGEGGVGIGAGGGIRVGVKVGRRI